MPVIFVFLSALLGGGVALLVIGIRGRLIDAHPVCRRCGFDLFGLPTDATICSECGSDLTRPRAIRIGNRERFTGTIISGVLLLAVLIIGFSVIAWENSQDFNWIGHAPTWWLIRRAQTPDTIRRNEALAELLRRVQGGELSDGSMQKLIAAALAIQADKSIAWFPAWGSMVETARTSGHVSDDQWRQYALNSCDMQLTARPKVRASDALVPMQLGSGISRVSDINSLCVRYSAVDEGSDLSGNKMPTLFRGSSLLSSGNGGTAGTDLYLDKKQLAKAALGEKTIRIVLSEEIFPSNDSIDRGEKPIIQRTLHLTAPWVLVDNSAPIAQPINNEQLRAAVVKSLTIGECSITSLSRNNNCEVEVKCTGPPAPLAYDMFIRTGGQDILVGSVHFSAGANGDYETGRSTPNIAASQVDIVLKPSAAACAETIDQTSYWNGEVTIPNVPLTRR